MSPYRLSVDSTNSGSAASSADQLESSGEVQQLWTLEGRREYVEQEAMGMQQQFQEVQLPPRTETSLEDDLLEGW